MPAPQPQRHLASPLTFDDLVADLAWPKLLRAPGPLAIRPARLGLAFIYLLGLVILLVLIDWMLGPKHAASLQRALKAMSEDIDSFREAASRLEAVSAGNELYEIFITRPAAILREHPLVFILAFPVILIWTTLFGGAISRTAATEFCAGVSISWPQALGFALSKWRSLAASIFLPLAIVWVIALALAAGGWALFSLPGLNLLGGLLYGVSLLGGFIATIVIIAFALGHPMLVPSVAVEGTDAIDAVQHAYSFVFARPLRLILYTLLLVVQMIVVMAIAALVVWLTLHFTQETSSAWTSDRGDRVLELLNNINDSEATRKAHSDTADSLSRVDRYTYWLAALWTVIPVGLLFSLFVSFYWCASTLLYLTMRRITDGQDMSECWMPTMIPGTLAASSPIASSASAQAVADNGPADET